jgi:hypothetical protein
VPAIGDRTVLTEFESLPTDPVLFGEFSHNLIGFQLFAVVGIIILYSQQTLLFD